MMQATTVNIQLQLTNATTGYQEHATTCALQQLTFVTAPSSVITRCPTDSEHLSNACDILLLTFTLKQRNDKHHRLVM